MNRKTIIPLVLQQLFYTISWPLMRFFTCLRIEGGSHIGELKGNFILASNHVTELDPAYARAALPFFSKHSPLYFASNTKERYRTFGWRSLLYGGTVFKAFGAYPVYKGQNDFAVALQHHTELLRRGGTVSIFPEGKRSSDGRLGVARGGVAFLAFTADVPVLPVAIEGLHGITFKEFFLRKRKVTVRIGKPLAPRSIVKSPKPTFEDYKKGAEIVLAHIKGLLENTGIESPFELPVLMPAKELQHLS